MKKLSTLLIVLFIGFQISQAQTTPYITTVPFLTGFTKPVKLTNCKDDRLFVVEQDGKIKIVDSGGVVRPTAFLDINSRVGSTGNEQGLLGLAFHPNYKQNGYFYVDYTDNNGNTVIARYSVNPADSNLALFSSELVLLNITQPFSNHNGGDVNFGPDGYLYIGMGDGGSAGDPNGNGQNTAARLAKMLRIDVDHGTPYAIPPDNPFINSPTAAKEIWNVGMRNPWRYSFDRLTGDLWIGDVGQGAWEEVDFQPAGTAGGQNYGWRCYEGNTAYNTAGCQPQNFYEPPVYVYSHSGYCSISGGVVYRGGKYANLYGYYIFADYCNPIIQTLKKNGTVFQHDNHSTWTGAGISSFGEDVYGEVYVTNVSAGDIRKIADTTSCSPVAHLADVDTLTVCDTSTVLVSPYGDGNLYLWTFNGTTVPGAVTNELYVNQSGLYMVTAVSSTTFCGASDTVYVDLKGVSASVSISGIDTFYCIYNSSAVLNATPPGGVFSGAGISGVNFDPATAGLGTHIIHYDYTNANGCISSGKVVTIVDACAGLNDAQNLSIHSLYPNPVNEILTADIANKTTGKASIEILDISGRVVKYSTMDLVGQSFTLNVNCTELSSGSYFLRIQSADAAIIQPFMIVK